MNPEIIKINHIHATYLYPCDSDSSSSDEELTKKVEALTKDAFPHYQPRPPIKKVERPEVHLNASKQTDTLSVNRQWGDHHFGD